MRPTVTVPQSTLDRVAHAEPRVLPCASATQPFRGLAASGGFTLIEVLVTLVLLALGLIGVIGLQARGQQAELESYQRGQAIALVQDMVDRINTDRAAAHALSYVTSTPVGGGSALTDCTSLAGAQYDLCDWGNELSGAAEANGTCTTGTGNATGCVGAMLGAVGCVTYNSAPASVTNPGGELSDSTGAVEPGTGVYTVTVAWQGVAPTSVAPTNTCGQGLYPVGASPANDAWRRIAVATLRIGNLNSP